ncbi:hypothetical protein RN001_011439 [Aquatica leii]|uniref:V-type proton ATPase subunit S1 n=1 Tax=Aquatica leii TaxID=1421715 RepID=A0AAN7PSX5_9COLE|nr:hypothetical protein RN001_011439 [Aquatica leii]
MHYTQCILITILFLKTTTSSLLLWSSKNIETPALSEFTNADLRDLEIDTETQVVAFTSKSLDVAQQFNQILNKEFRAYILSPQILLDNSLELSGNEDLNAVLHDYLASNVTVALIVDNDKRLKRSSSSVELLETYQEPINGPIVYSAVLPADKTVEAIIYSSKPPLLKTNASTIILGATNRTNLDIRDSYTRLIANIPVENGKISLRFKFYWISSYWYINSVEVEFVDAQIKTYNLTMNQELTAPRRFSYHCGGSAVFTDVENSIELHLFDVQAQPDAHNHRFNDAYNCVPFTTVPILSGIFVTFILEIGLIVGLTAINSIKTMDKFDNHKTKQLTITVWE